MEAGANEWRKSAKFCDSADQQPLSSHGDIAKVDCRSSTPRLLPGTSFNPSTLPLNSKAMSCQLRLPFSFASLPAGSSLLMEIR
jgi:hypothetical protein